MEGLLQTGMHANDSMPMCLVGLPISDAHREGLIKALMRPETLDWAPFRSLLVLLEEDERYEQALAVLRKSPLQTEFTITREAAYLFKLDREKEAREALLHFGAESLSTAGAFLSLAEVDLRSGRTEAARKLMLFFILNDQTPVVGRLLLCRRYARLFGAPPAEASRELEAIILRYAGESEQAERIVEAAGFSPRADDLALLLVVFRNSEALGRKREELLGAEGLPLRERRVLLENVADPAERLSLWEGMAEGQAACADLVVSPRRGYLPKQALEAHLPKITELVETNPDDAALAAVLGYFENECGDGKATERLKGVAGKFKASPASENVTDDPALFAIRQLADKLEGEEMWGLFAQGESYGKLPPADRFRYLIAGQLDTGVIELLNTEDFSKGDLDDVSLKIASYLRGRAGQHVFPDEVMGTLRRLAPEIALGGPEKSAQDAVHTMDWLAEIFRTRGGDEGNAKEVYARFLELAAERGKEFLGEANAGYGRKFAEGVEAAARSTVPGNGKFAILLPFSGREREIPDVFLSSGSSWALGFKSLDPKYETALLPLKHSSWSSCLSASFRGKSPDPAVLAKVRRIFAEGSERTLVYDFTVAFGILECPDGEVKKQAFERISKMEAAPDGDPFFAAALYLARVASGMPVEEAAKVLEGADKTLWIRTPRVMAILFNGADRSGVPRVGVSPPGGVGDREKWMAPLVAALGPDRPQAAGSGGRPQTPRPEAAVEEPPKRMEMDLDDRFQFYREAGKNKDAEVVALARKTLVEYAESGSRVCSPGVGMAKDVLYENEVYEEFLTSLEKRLRDNGLGELELARRMFEVERSHGVWIRKVNPLWPRRLLELDPDDLQAAKEVFQGAVEDTDRTLILKCLRTFSTEASPLMAGVLGSGRLPHWNGQSVSALGLFAGDDFKALIDSVLSLPKPPFDRNSEAQMVKVSLMPFFGRVAQEQPVHLAEVLEWAELKDISYLPQLVDLADQLPPKDRVEVGTRLLADVLFMSPPIAGKEGPQRFEARAQNRFAGCGELYLLTMQGRKWVMPLAEISGKYPESQWTAGRRFLISVAAEPTVAAWERLLAEFLQGGKPEDRDPARRYARNILKHVDGAEGLRGYLARQDPIAKALLQKAGERTLSKYTQAIRSAAEVPDSKQVSELYTASAAAYAAGKESGREEFDRLIFESMLCHAGEREWSKYFNLVSAKDSFKTGWAVTGNWSVWERAPAERLAEFARVALARLVPQQELASRVEMLFMALLKGGFRDRELLGKFRHWLELRPYGGETAGVHLQYLDFLMGSPQAVDPYFSIAAGENGEPVVSWVLTCLALNGSRNPLIGRFGFLSGKFDLEILAGGFSDRLELFATVEAAAYSGKMELPVGTRFVSMIARERGGKVIRTTRSISMEAKDEGFLPLALAPVILGKPDQAVAVKAEGESDPFFASGSLEISMDPGQSVELLELPWLGRKVAEVEGWIGAVDGNVNLKMLSLGGDGSVLREDHVAGLQGGDVLFPCWARLRTRQYSSPPAETERIVLVAQASGDAKGQCVLHVSGMSMKKPEDEPRYDGFGEIGTVKGFSAGVSAISADGKSIALFSGRNVGVFDLVGKVFSGWIPLQESKGAISGAGERLLLANKTLIFSSGDGAIHMISLDEKVDRVIAYGKSLFQSDSLALSPDGRFLAWPGVMAGVNLVDLQRNAEDGERVVETPQIYGLAFSEDSGTLKMRGQQSLRLAMSDWRNGTPRPLPEKEAPMASPSSRGVTEGTGAFSAVSKVTFQTDARRITKKGVFQEDGRTVAVELGAFHIGAENRIYYVSPGGRISQVDVEKIKGYVPPPDD